MAFGKSALAVLAIIFLGCGMTFAQEETASSSSSAAPLEPVQTAAPSDIGPKFGMGFQFGAILINGVNYNSIRFQPDFAIGKFGVGLDLNFEFDANGNFRATEWNSWQAILSKLMYIRYGIKGEPVYIKLGGIADFTFDDGFILDYYSNMFNYPALRKLGIAFDLDLNMFGFETMVANVLQFDLMGMRAYFRPLANTEIPLMKKIEIGATVVADLGPQNPVPATNTPYNFTWTNNNVPVIEYGADLGMPIVDLPLVFKMRSYLDFAGIANKGTGEALGIEGRVITILPYRMEVRLLQPKFLPSYFDTYYDAVRSVKYAGLDSVTNGYLGWLFSSGVVLFDDKICAEVKVEQSFSAGSLPELTFNFILGKGLLKMLDARFTWNRKNIWNFADIFGFVNASSMMLLGIDYYISENLVLMLDFKKTFQMDSSGNLQPFSSTFISTRIVF
jgi:hypothetical protein